MTEKFRNAECGSCSRSMAHSEHINLVTLQYQAEWEYPVSGNVLTGESGKAVAVVCDACIDEGTPDIRFAIESRGDAFYYHSIAGLQEVEQDG